MRTRIRNAPEKVPEYVTYPKTTGKRTGSALEVHKKKYQNTYRRSTEEVPKKYQSTRLKKYQNTYLADYPRKLRTA
ncbi:hypothetical protein [Paenibacillus sp. FSL M7-1046]|uniref:hypothetical protein n=1 Tax=Paenibacillus sp. FSL M7-1046 TaxID=2975315 RepID=UPI0030F56EDE